VEGGRFAYLAAHLPVDGQTMKHTPSTGEYGLDTRMQLAGVPEVRDSCAHSLFAD
jgi:hypothetical protein